MRAWLGLPAILGVPFEKPTTKDFVWPCWGPSINLGPIHFCYSFVYFVLTIAFLVTILFFVVGLRKRAMIPGTFQNLVEMGVEFVRNQIVMQMIGPDGLPFLPFLSTLFFFIFFGNILEVIPGVSFPLNSRIAFPIVMALISWVTYNAVGISRHGLGGYLKLVGFPPGAPKLLYVLLTPIEFISVILVRPLTLSVRLFANMVAGHFILAVFFLGTIAMATGHYFGHGLSKTVEAFLGGGLSAVSFTLGVVLVGFEIFVAALQAFIFTVLTASYIAGAMAEEH
jgi:F-type H+-transporting ATPase subunit a